ncbi:AMP-binding protein [Urechidicola sp. KH5]
MEGWNPTENIINNSNIAKMMRKHHFASYTDLYSWSVSNKELFWTETVNNLQIKLHHPYQSILNISEGVTKAKWLDGAKLNIIDSCFQNSDEATAIVFQKPNQELQKVTQKELEFLVNQIANGLREAGVNEGDCIGIDMPMTLEAVAIYLGAIKAGVKVATVADSFAPKEIAVRLALSQPKLVFTQDVMVRTFKHISLYDKVVQAGAAKIVVLPVQDSPSIRNQDVLWNAFLSTNKEFESVKQSPEDHITILFSSGTTGEPKAIPWNHTTPIKGAADGYYHQDIHQNDVVCWPTNLGWMMGPWLVFAALINKASIALYYDAPLTSDFGRFIQNAKVTMLGVIPSIVKHWKNTQCMEPFDWNAIKCFSSTGEVSNPTEMNYLMHLANNKPVIEYCGGTEIGGGYITSTIVQPNLASTFSTPALGSDFLLLGENEEEAKQGEVFLIPPIMGLSTALLNRDHHKVYYQYTPEYKTQLRRHGDELLELENGYYKMLGRVDDAMNLGGIKVSATQIEAVLQPLDFLKEAAAIAVPPKEGGPSLLVIYYVPSNQDLSKEEYLKQMQKSVRGALNPLFKVFDCVPIKQLPRTASNKVMRRKLRDDYNKLYRE